MTAALSAYIDQYLQKYVMGLSSFLRDTGHLLELLNNKTCWKNCLWVSLDVKALYSNIDHSFGLRVVRYFLEGDPLLPNHQKNFLLDILEFVLNHNYFKFEDKFFLQVKGIAMGAKCAPSYVNLAMGFLELKLDIVGMKEVQFYKRWMRYSDDIFFIWRGGEERLQSFLSYVNGVWEELQFTMVYSESELQFLDTRVVNKGGRLCTDLFVKP
ncbi:hypothetical protein PRIEUP_LOCUS1974 [Pristimantis euphronides]